MRDCLQCAACRELLYVAGLVFVVRVLFGVCCLCVAFVICCLLCIVCCCMFVVC